jgi:hypothetical protein
MAPPTPARGRGRRLRRPRCGGRHERADGRGRARLAGLTAARRLGRRPAPSNDIVTCRWFAEICAGHCPGDRHHRAGRGTGLTSARLGRW